MDIVKRLRRWSAEESTYELLSDAADEIERVRLALQHILTHCKSDTPPNAQAIILFVNNALEEEE